MQDPKKNQSLVGLAIKVVLAVTVLYVASMFVYRLFHGMAYDPMATTYVNIQPTDSDRFVSDLVSIAEAHGLKPWRNKVAYADGRTLYVVEATGHALNIRAENVPLSGYECGESKLPGPDPRQFVIHVLPSMWLPLRDRARALFQLVSLDLSNRGYHIAAKPSVPCISADKEEGGAGDA